MESIATRLKKASDMAERLALKSSEVISISINGYETDIADFHIEPKTLVRVFHELKVSRSAVRAREGEEFVIICFIHRRFRFVSSLRKPEAAQFMALNGQRRIASAKAPLRRLTKRSQLRLIEVGADEQ